MSNPKLKIDTNPELPLAIIEDTEEGMGVCEVTVSELYAKEIVRRYNALPELMSIIESIRQLTTPPNNLPWENNLNALNPRYLAGICDQVSALTLKAKSL